MTIKRTYHNSVFVMGEDLEYCTRIPQLLESFEKVLVTAGDQAATKFVLACGIAQENIVRVPTHDIGLISSKEVVYLGEAPSNVVAMIGFDNLTELTDTTKVWEITNLLHESNEDLKQRLWNAYGKEHYSEREEVYRKEFKTGYTLIKTKLWGESPYHGKEGLPKEKALDMTVAYNHDGYYIGDSKSAHFYCNKLGIKPEPPSKDAYVCNNGYCEKDEKWYGWSHRAIVGFKIGDKLFDSKFKGATERTKFTEYGSKTITTKEEARQAAINFAAYVS